MEPKALFEVDEQFHCNGGNHDFRKRRAALAHRHSAADHHSVGPVLALTFEPPVDTPNTQWSLVMDKDRIKGSAEQAKGKLKEAAGKVTGDSKLQSEGQADQLKGKVQNAIGGIKDTLRGK
jgi:uncharacterized protein YjbJ (UPF0337 family)